MSQLVIIQKRGKFSVTIPHKILVDGQFIGIMKDKQVSIEMPMGRYAITVQSMIPFIYATQIVEIQPYSSVTLEFSDREQLWDALFVLDIILWLIKRFFFTKIFKSARQKTPHLYKSIHKKGFLALFLLKFPIFSTD